MKKVIVSLVFLLFFGCKSTDIDPYTNGIVIGGLFNGKVWERTKLRAFVQQKCINSIDIQITVDNEQGFRRESLGFYRLPLRTGEYSVKKYVDDKTNCLADSSINTKNIFATYSTSKSDGGVIKDYYDILESGKEVNKLVITKYDGKSKYISGEFNVTFLLKHKPDGSKYYFDSVDTIRITKALFEASGF
jgi:hypothetical protein